MAPPSRPFLRRSDGSTNGPVLSQVPLDLTIFEPDATTPSDDKSLTEALLNHYNLLTPSSETQQQLTNLVNRSCEILESIVVNPSLFESGIIEQVRCVGSFKTGTWLAGSNIADLVVMFRTLPTLEAIENLANFVRQRLTAIPESGNCYHVEIQLYGFRVTFKESVVQILITTIPMNLKKTDPDLHVSFTTQKAALTAMTHARWLDENASHTTIKVLIRILKDFRRRFKGFSYMNTWMTNLLAVYAVMNNQSRQTLPINQAFRRVFHLLSAGFLLPGSGGLLDPCEPGNLHSHTALPLAEQDELCYTAQTLLRALLYRQYSLIFSHNDFDQKHSREEFMDKLSQAVGIRMEWAEPISLPNQEQLENGKPVSEDSSLANPDQSTEKSTKPDLKMES